jgi:hypothetical protein
MKILEAVSLIELLCIVVQPDLMVGASNSVSECVFMTDLIVQGQSGAKQTIPFCTSVFNRGCQFASSGLSRL